MSELTATDIGLLIKLRDGRHFKANPGELNLLMPDVEEPERLASFRRVYGAGLVKKVDRMGEGIWLRITDAGLARAENAAEAKRAPTLRERIRSVPVGKGAWDLVKLGIAFALGIVANKYFGK